MHCVSIAVALDDLADAIAGFRFAYLVTLSDDGRAHVVAVSPAVEADGLRITDLGSTTRANVAARASVTLVWPPADVDQHSLIVDGAGRVEGAELVVTPYRAVLHRPAPAPATTTSGCQSDCIEISAPG